MNNKTQLKVICLFITLFVLVVFAGVSCSPKYYRESHMDKMRWIEGTWASTEEGITISEVWSYAIGDGFDGISFIAVSSDTLFKEQLQIRFGPKRSILLNTISGQVQFETTEPLQLIKVSKSGFSFQTEDKSKTITYRKKRSGEMQIDLNEQNEDEFVNTKYLLNKL